MRDLPCFHQPLIGVRPTMIEVTARIGISANLTATSLFGPKASLEHKHIPKRVLPIPSFCAPHTCLALSEADKDLFTDGRKRPHNLHRSKASFLATLDKLSNTRRMRPKRMRSEDKRLHEV